MFHPASLTKISLQLVTGWFRWFVQATERFLEQVANLILEFHFSFNAILESLFSCFHARFDLDLTQENSKVGFAKRLEICTAK
jgi:hypothetical protein